MKRNRSIRTLPLDNLNLLNHPLPETPTYINEHYFGEEVLLRDSPHSSDDSDVILASVRDLGDKSSSSSLSWGDEYKSEASKKVRDELERMDRVLRREEPIPDYYDKEEYEEWMQFFPNLSVLGTRLENPEHVQSLKSKTYTFEDIYDKKKTITVKYRAKNSKNVPKIAENDLDVDSFLKVAPLGQRQSSSRSLISSQISSSKWLKDEEYEALPFLGIRAPKVTPKGILKNTLVLPPIETSQFRSISATPRRESKSLSALSVDQKYSGFKRKVGNLYK